MPTLAPTSTVIPAMSIGSTSRASSRSATALAYDASGISVSSTPNSSPPSRAARSRSRRSSRRRAATAMSNASPAAWPRLSLTVLKSSRSRKRAATEPVPVRVGERRLGRLDETAAVGQAGQRIVEGLEAELCLQRAPLGHVAGEHADEAGEASQDEQRQHGGPDRDHHQPAGCVRAERDEERAGDHGRREADQPHRSQPGDGDGARFGQDAHRRMRGRGAEEEVRDEVDAIDPAPADIAALEVLERVDLVTDERAGQDWRPAGGTRPSVRRASSGGPWPPR